MAPACALAGNAVCCDMTKLSMTSVVAANDNDLALAPFLALREVRSWQQIVRLRPPGDPRATVTLEENLCLARLVDDLMRTQLRQCIVRPVNLEPPNDHLAKRSSPFLLRVTLAACGRMGRVFGVVRHLLPTLHAIFPKR